MNQFRSSLISPLGNNYMPDQYCPLDLSTNKVSKDVAQTGLSQFIDNVKKQANAQVAFGGYLEKRNLYTCSDHFDSSERNIHLGVDYWIDAGTRVFAPLDGIIHSFAYNDQELDYGYTIILLHESNGETLYTLYGHLSIKYYNTWQVGAEVKAGDTIAEVGHVYENGGWLPHLHFQLITDMGEWLGDFPGVCSEDDVCFYKTCCPDPKQLFRR